MAARASANSLLAYRTLRFEEGQFILEDAILFDIKGSKSSYFLRSEKIAIKMAWAWPLSFSIHVTNPRVTIAPERLQHIAFSSSNSVVHWFIEIEEGILEWADNHMPSSQFSLFATSDHTLQMGMSWERGVLEIEKKEASCRSVWSEVPFDVLWKYVAWSGWSLPISDLQGILSGSMEIEDNQRITFAARGEHLGFTWGKMRLGGSVVCEGVWDKGAPEKMRYSLVDGHLFTKGSSCKTIRTRKTDDFGAHCQSQLADSCRSDECPPSRVGEEERRRGGPKGQFCGGGEFCNCLKGSEIQSVDACMTYQANLGIKFEGHGLAIQDSLEMPIEWEAKSCFVLGQSNWASGNLQLGKLRGDLLWNDAERFFSWKELGVEEAAILQGFASHFIPGIKDWVWHSGTVRGGISLEDLSMPHLTELVATDLRLEMGSFECEAGLASYRTGDWEVESFKISQSQNLLQGNAKWRSWRQEEKVRIEGEIAGVRFSGNWDWDGCDFLLSLPYIEGEIPACLWPNVSGNIAAEAGGFELFGSWDGIEGWGLACRVFDGHASVSNCTFSNIECSVLANPDSFDLLSVRGLFAIALAEERFDASFFSPRLQWKGDSSWFDLRLHRGASDLLRLKGSQERGIVQLDSLSSHLLGKPLSLQNCLWQEGAFSFLALETELDGSLFQSYLWEGLPPLGQIQFSGRWQEDGPAFSLTASDWSFQVENRENLWDCRLLLGSYLCSWSLYYKEGVIGFSEGRLVSPSLSLDFEGKMDRHLEGNLILRTIQAQGNPFFSSVSFEGSVEGQAQVRFTTNEIESDLDLFVKDVIFQGFSLENVGPLHIYYSSLRGAFIKGLDCRIHQDHLEGYAKIDLVQFDKVHNRWNVQKAKTHFPSDVFALPLLDQGGNIDCLADFSFAADFSDWSCMAKEVFLPIGGTMHHFQDLRAINRGSSLVADAFLCHTEKWAKISFEMARKEAHFGKFVLQELGQDEPPLSFHWSYQNESGLLIHSIEGAFGGIDASFCGVEGGQLIGSAGLNFQRLSEWIPSNVARSFQELKMGKGYELKGNLHIDPKRVTDISFKGIFSGKQIELAGFQLRTLLSQVDLHFVFSRENSSNLVACDIHIDHLKISDSACILKIDDLWIQGVENRPLTIDMPQFIIEELRPSLLVRSGGERGSISPLVVRQFKMVDFCGLLDDGKSYSAKGDLSFINSFKREQTVFDLPANVFGRIIGLDLELLIPVKGELTFVLKDGYFNLEELKRAYSEGERSEFFLVQSEATRPRMDLDGNLQILVKMKQFVLFSLTEAFMISIDGKLHDPHFRLQKKKRFL